MDAKQYIDTLRRICSTDCFCDNCDFKKNGTCPLDKTFLLSTPSEDIVSSVEQWAKDHPVKTRQSEFLKRFPNADMQRISTLFPCVMDQTIRPTRCVKYESFSSPKKCVECRNDYWHEEVDN